MRDSRSYPNLIPCINCVHPAVPLEFTPNETRMETISSGVDDTVPLAKYDQILQDWYDVACFEATKSCSDFHVDDTASSNSPLGAPFDIVAPDVNSFAPRECDGATTSTVVPRAAHVSAPNAEPLH